MEEQSRFLLGNQEFPPPTSSPRGESLGFTTGRDKSTPVSVFTFVALIPLGPILIAGRKVQGHMPSPERIHFQGADLFEQQALGGVWLDHLGPAENEGADDREDQADNGRAERGEERVPCHQKTEGTK